MMDLVNTSKWTNVDFLKYASDTQKHLSTINPIIFGKKRELIHDVLGHIHEIEDIVVERKLTARTHKQLNKLVNYCANKSIEILLP